MKRFNNIVYVSESSVDQDTTLARAVTLAQNNQANLTVIDVVSEMTAGIGIPPSGSIAADLTAVVVDERRKRLESLISPYQGKINIQSDILISDKRFIEVIRTVLNHQYDLLIKPAENPDYLARIFGTDDMHLLRKCPCPVWLMKSQEKPNYKNIVAAIDFEFGDNDMEEQVLNKQILEIASSLALSDFAELHLVHVWDAPEAGFVRLWAENPDAAEMKIIEGEHLRKKNRMENLIIKLREWIGEQACNYLSPRIHLPKGNAKKEIPALANSLHADLVVMGTTARAGIAGLIIGNTAEEILEQLQCSVLAIKPHDFAASISDD